MEPSATVGHRRAIGSPPTGDSARRSGLPPGIARCRALAVASGHADEPTAEAQLRDLQGLLDSQTELATKTETVGHGDASGNIKVLLDGM